MSLTKEQTEYPRDVFSDIIDAKSNYAFYLHGWVKYQDAKKFRLKMFHDAKSFDGREVFHEWPNGSHIGDLHDDEIEWIRISEEQF